MDDTPSQDLAQSSNVAACLIISLLVHSCASATLVKSGFRVAVNSLMIMV